jgi:hypothetical protein
MRVQAQKSRQKVAAESMTRVQKIHRALQSGQLKSELRTVSEAIHAARALTMQIEAAGLKDERDFHVHVGYMTPDLSMLWTRRYERGQEAAIQEDLSGPGKCCIPVGLVFGIRDPEHGGDWLIGSRPFLDTPLVRTALKQQQESEVVGIN